MEQDSLFPPDDIWEATRTACRAVASKGGNSKAWPKIVGHMLFPHKDPDDAGKYLSNCLDPNRQEKLDPQQLLLIAREARKVGCHVLMNFIADDSGYKAIPIEPENELSEMQRQAAKLVRYLADLTKRQERMLANQQDEHLRAVK